MSLRGLLKASQSLMQHIQPHARGPCLSHNNCTYVATSLMPNCKLTVLAKMSSDGWNCGIGLVNTGRLLLISLTKPACTARILSMLCIATQSLSVNVMQTACCVMLCLDIVKKLPEVPVCTLAETEAASVVHQPALAADGHPVYQ